MQTVDVLDHAALGGDTLNRVQHQLRAWVAHNFDKDRPDPASAYQCLLGAMEELGELAHAHLKGEQGIRTNEDHEAEAKDALGDLIIYLLDYSNARDWIASAIVSNTWDEVRQRDWKARPDTG